MKKSIFRVGAAIAASAALAIAPVAAAHAVPWDSSDITFQNGRWDLENFYIEDANVFSPANSATPTYDEYTDIWDGAGKGIISMDAWSTDQELSAFDTVSMEVTDDAVTGDKVITAPMDSTGTDFDGKLEVTGELRIFAAGDLFRSTYFIKNITAEPITISFNLRTEFGTSGSIFSYQGQTDSILAVPAAEDAVSTTALADANVQWAVHTESDDPPAGIAWGLKTAPNPGVVVIDGDQYDAYYDDVVIPAGATIAFAQFNSWTPTLLVADNYTNGDGNAAHQTAYGEAVTAAAAEFDTFSGRLTNGLDGYNVVNWGPVSSTPELPNTGVDAVAIASISGFAAVALVAGALMVALRRRSAN